MESIEADQALEDDYGARRENFLRLPLKRPSSMTAGSHREYGKMLQALPILCIHLSVALHTIALVLAPVVRALPLA